MVKNKIIFIILYNIIIYLYILYEINKNIIELRISAIYFLLLLHLLIMLSYYKKSYYLEN
jgi:hypothetical protein